LEANGYGVMFGVYGWLAAHHDIIIEIELYKVLA
jgi:hypothetical protein